MTSSNLQRWISPFPWNLNMKGDCETHQGSWSTGVEYYSMCISLVFGSLNDVVGNIKSSMGLRALIWIAKTTSAVNRKKQRKMYITHPADCETDQWIFDQREMASNDGFSAEISYFLSSAQKVKKQHLYLAQTHAHWVECMKLYHVHTVCIMNLIYAGEGCPGRTCSTHFHRAYERKKLASDVCERS